MFRSAPLCLLLLLAAPPLVAAAPADPLAEVQRMGGETDALRERQLALRTELNAVGDRIEALKSQGRRLLRREDLDSALRRSQELSTELTAIATRISQTDEARHQAQQRVVDGLSAQLEALRVQLEATLDREQRRQLISRMRQLRADRGRYSAALPQGDGVPTLSSASPDDPEDLLEQADALRDSRDKVNRRLASVQQRLEQLRGEQELERRMNEFVGEESLFDESDRRLGRGLSAAVLVPQQDPNPRPDGLPEAVVDRGGDLPSPAPQQLRDPTSELGGMPADDLRALEAEQKRLGQLAGELETRAREAEEKASQLR
ncbi:MAG: TetR family transcriptional regulator [Myxococcota bacterium]|nr:TetR family transcriptional regulator [Myxococcota bacterium]